MSLALLPKCLSLTPADVITGTALCSGGVATASNEVEPEWIHATAAFSGGQQISVLRVRNETPTESLRQAIPELYRVDGGADKLTTEMLPSLSKLYRVDSVDRFDTDATLELSSVGRKINS